MPKIGVMKESFTANVIPENMKKRPAGRREVSNRIGATFASVIVIPQFHVVATPTPLGGRISEV